MPVMLVYRSPFTSAEKRTSSRSLAVRPFVLIPFLPKNRSVRIGAVGIQTAYIRASDGFHLHRSGTSRSPVRPLGRD
jgi:hypothetical protein